MGWGGGGTTKRCFDSQPHIYIYIHIDIYILIYYCSFHFIFHYPKINPILPILFCRLPFQGISVAGLSLGVKGVVGSGVQSFWLRASELRV